MCVFTLGQRSGDPEGGQLLQEDQSGVLQVLQGGSVVVPRVPVLVRPPPERRGRCGMITAPGVLTLRWWSSRVMISSSSGQHG